MKSFSVLAILCFLCAVPAFSQQTSKMETQVAIGLVSAKAHVAFQAQVVMGLRKEKWFAGIGTGVDFYNNPNSLPLFAKVQRALTNGAKAPFVYAQGGYHIGWVSAGDKLFYNNVRGGAYYEAGVGYDIPVFKKRHLFFDAGYSAKYYQFSVPQLVGYDRNNPASYSTATRVLTNYRAAAHRLSLKIGFRF